MKRPTIRSMPGTGADWPETVLPYTTSSSPLYRASKSAQAPTMRVLTVSFCARAKAWSAAASGSGTSRVRSLKPCSAALTRSRGGGGGGEAGELAAKVGLRPGEALLREPGDVLAVGPRLGEPDVAPVSRRLRRGF